MQRRGRPQRPRDDEVTAGTPSSRDWVQITATALPGFAALLTAVAALSALVFTAHSVNETNQQLKIAEQGQITDRYNAAITNLGSRSEDVRLGGIYALQRLMEDSPRDQPTVIAVLCAFVRDHSSEITPRTKAEPTDLQAAVTVVLTRDTAHDGPRTHANLRGAKRSGAIGLLPRGQSER